MHSADEYLISPDTNPVPYDFLDWNTDFPQDATHPGFIGASGIDRNLMSESGAPLPSYDQAWERLISGTVPQDELAPLIETVFSNGDVTSMVDGLQGNDAQTFIDVIDTVCTLLLRPWRMDYLTSVSIFCMSVRRWITSILNRKYEEYP